MTHDSLIVCSLTQEQHSKTCGYWYTVTTGSMAHTAFRTRVGLERWMQERGLRLDGELPVAPVWGWTRIVGSYRTEMHWDLDAFAKMAGERSRTLSNGDWVEAVITTDADGIRTVHTLNPNVQERKTFDYRESDRLMQ